MKNFTLLLLFFSALAVFAACSNEGVSIDPSQQQAKIDSIVSARTLVIKDSLDAVCTQRMTEEVSAKVDSIVNVMKPSM
ncbi:MAG: hypothetical protein R3E32_15165 [Chitinophagales bacterium]